MISLEIQIVLALLLDYLFGDPRSFPHPVKIIGSFALKLESRLRKWIKNPKLAGSILVFLVLLSTGGSVFIFLKFLSLFHPLVEDCGSIFFLYTSIAVTDLRGHSLNVYHSLVNKDIFSAKNLVAMIVSRDTQKMSSEDIARASVESVAENTSDGVIAPLFYATIGGPMGAVLYKAVNTLDSTFGYKNTQYLDFGWASAKLDDMVNFIPSRITAVIIPISAYLRGLSWKNAWRIFLRDRNKHNSPNAGQIESAMAGAMNVQLGGSGSYFGETIDKPTLGDPLEPITPEHIRKVNQLMILTMLLSVILFLGIRIILIR